MPARRPTYSFHGEPKPKPVGTLGEFAILSFVALCAAAFFAWQIILPVIGLLWVAGAI